MVSESHERRVTRRGVRAAASAVVALGIAAAATAVFGGGDDGPEDPGRAGVRESASVASAAPSPAPWSGPATPSATPSPVPRTSGSVPTESPRLYRHPDSQVLDWVRAHPGDPRRPVVESRIASRPTAVWFTEYAPGTVTSRVRAVTSAAAAQDRVPVLVAYAIPDRDCGGASEGGAPDLDAYDGWIDRFAAGLGSGETVVILEPDSIAQAGCLPEGRRADRFASLARAGRVLKAANPRARVYYDAGHSGWNAPEKQAALLRQAGAASADGVFSNVSNFRGTADESAYDRRVLDALGGPPDLGAVIDTSRNGNGAPRDGQWCDPAGRRIGRAPTLDTGEARIDAYLWVKLPGESDGCRGAAGEFSPSYAYELASP
ncbi:glycoside hydrolase family 6 protein [Streptomyces sp. NPDC000345]|uniref:glycoside hydrolase family 6 protein n=1 Tax=Streptomyces sp. NPDC000345 TaxID=3364537 RepID=UPI0036743A9F